MNNFLLRICVLSALFFYVFLTNAQEKPKVDIEAGLDVVSRYVWRGSQLSDSPNLQPYATLSYGGLSLTGFGSYATSKSFSEIDWTLAYTLHGITLSLVDFYNEEEDLALNDFFNWKRANTAHLVETSLAWELPIQKFPLRVTASTLVYGADLNQNGNQNLSTYFELLYPFTVKNYELSAFVGGTGNKGYYADQAAVVNTGISLMRPIEVTDRFAFDLNMCFAVNPRAEDAFFIVGVTF